MAERTGISWTDHTFNPWTGCLRVSPGCDNCYAAMMARRNSKTFGGWEPGAERKRTSIANWRQPRRWNCAAAEAGIRRRVFCASMADVFDNAVSDEWRDDLWALIRATPSLDWQLLTKRPQNIAKMLPPDWGDGYPNVWLGTTVENQAEADRRIPHLLAVPAAVRFLSCEPLLGPVRLQAITPGKELDIDSLRGDAWRWGAEGVRYDLKRHGPHIHWIIIGGESGNRARPMHSEWARALMAQCSDARVPVWFKQVGTGWQPDHGWGRNITGKGDDPAQWPAEFRVQEMPQCS